MSIFNVEDFDFSGLLFKSFLADFLKLLELSELLFVNFFEFFENVALSLFFFPEFLGFLFDFFELFGVFLINHETSFEGILEGPVSSKETSHTLIAELSPSHSFVKLI